MGFILKIHKNATNYSYIVDISVSIRDLHIRIISCFDEFLNTKHSPTTESN